MDGSGPVWRAEQDAREGRRLRDAIFSTEQAKREAMQETRLANKRADELASQVDLLRILLAVKMGALTRFRACELMGLTGEQFDAIERATVAIAVSVYNGRAQGGDDATQA